MNFQRIYRAAIKAVLTLSVCIVPTDALLAQSSISNAIFNAQQNNLASANAAIQRKDYAKARVILETLIEAGDTDAMMKLGDLHEKGLGGAKNPQAAFDLYKNAHVAGHPLALQAIIKIDKVNYYSGRIFKKTYSPSKFMYCPGSIKKMYEFETDANVYYQYDDNWIFDGNFLINNGTKTRFYTKKTFESHVMKFGGFIFNFEEKIIVWNYLGEKTVSKCIDQSGDK